MGYQALGSVFKQVKSVHFICLNKEIGSKQDLDSDFSVWAEINEVDDKLDELNSHFTENEFEIRKNDCQTVQELRVSDIKGKPTKTFLQIRVLRI
jgi:hypothetical protein